SSTSPSSPGSPLRSTTSAPSTPWRRAKAGELAPLLVRLEREARPDVLGDAARAAAVQIEECPIGGGDAELGGVGGAEDAGAADAARRGHAGDACRSEERRVGKGW